MSDDADRIQAVLDRARHRSPGAAMLAFLQAVDTAECLRAGGLADADATAMRARLVAPHRA